MTPSILVTFCSSVLPVILPNLQVWMFLTATAALRTLTAGTYSTVLLTVRAARDNKCMGSGA